jgi:hypothetical protein
MKITLPPDIESALTKQAQKKGKTPEMLALDTLRKRFVSSLKTKALVEEQGTLADYLADHIGVLSSSEYVSGGAHMSENCGKKFAAGLIKKRSEGDYDPH